MLRSSMPAMRFAWISTPGYAAPTGVTRRSKSPGAVGPTSTLLPLRRSTGTRSWYTSASEREGDAARLAEVGHGRARVLVDRNPQRPDVEPFEAGVVAVEHAPRRVAGLH